MSGPQSVPPGALPKPRESSARPKTFAERPRSGFLAAERSGGARLVNSPREEGSLSRTCQPP